MSHVCVFGYIGFAADVWANSLNIGSSSIVELVEDGEQLSSSVPFQMKPNILRICQKVQIYIYSYKKNMIIFFVSHFLGPGWSERVIFIVNYVLKLQGLSNELYRIRIASRGTELQVGLC